MVAFCHNCSLQAYAVPVNAVTAIPVNAVYFHQKKLRVMWSVKQVPLKSYSLKIRIDSVNQILKNKEKVT